MPDWASPRRVEPPPQSRLRAGLFSFLYPRRCSLKMKSKKRTLDRFDPRFADVKTLRLCDQVARALDLAFGGGLADELLQSISVESVVPAPTASRLLVTVRIGDASIRPLEALARLERARGLLRVGVAAAIHRKRAPELVFGLPPPEPQN